jgi:biopolymer transport protein ExbD
MRFGKHPLDDSEPIPMAPLIDIVFLTLVFFMVSSVYATLESEIDITLPTASSAELDERLQGEIFINLKDTGEIILNDKILSVQELQDILFKVAEHFPGGSVIIRGDKDAQLGNAIGILDACRNADIQRVSFAALPPED